MVDATLKVPAADEGAFLAVQLCCAHAALRVEQDHAHTEGNLGAS